VLSGGVAAETEPVVMSWLSSCSEVYPLNREMPDFTGVTIIRPGVRECRIDFDAMSGTLDASVHRRKTFLI
jgi:hypothetical protein